MAAIRVAVIGGGISGLGVAYALQRVGVPFRLIEAAPSAGGMIRSERVNGFLIEHGPNSALNASVDVEHVITDLGLLPDRVFAAPSSRKRYIVKHNHPVALPMGLIAFLRTPLWSGRAKARLLTEPFAAPPPAGEESIASFVSRRLGPEFLEYAADPFVSGVYAGDPERLSVQATFPKLAALERNHGGLIRGAIAGIGKPRAPRPRQRGIYSFRDGLGQLPAAISARLGESLWCGARVTALARQGDGFRVEVDRHHERVTFDADQVVIATPADVAATLTRPFDAGLAEDLAAIEYVPVAVVATAFARAAVQHPLDGFGCLVPRLERRTVLGSLWNSSLFPGRAPEGMVLLSNFVGGARHADLVDRSDDELSLLVTADLKRLLGVTDQPTWTRIIRYRRAIPQYVIGHAARVERIEHAIAKIPGLSLAGNYLRGVAVGDCLEKGLALGQTLGTALIKA
ncbi:MAG: protoporphyrinogen oxidase [Nitrospirota bacterium]